MPKSAASHVVADQSAAAAFLGAPESHGGVPVERIDTHAAMVFIAGDRAYKMKRAVHFAWMDFSTLEKRREACRREVLFNRRTAPELYLGVAPVLRGAGGALSLGPLDGETTGAEVIDWVVVMRAFDQNGLFDRLAQAGRLTPALMIDLADSVQRFHETAEVVGRGQTARGGAGGMRATVGENIEELGEHPDIFPESEVARLRDASAAAIARLEALLEGRWDRGLVRRCHGDLHLRNICLIDGRPTLFDCIEFNDAISCIDLLYDLAFLLMDLDYRGLRGLANVVLNRTLRDGAELESLAALPLFFSVRAAVRAKVAAAAEASQKDEAARAAQRDQATRYFAAARAYLAPPPARLLAVGGFSGSGKSTLARDLAPLVGPPPGALHLRSDVLRKRLMGVEELTPLPPEAYRPEVSQRVYDELLERARRTLGAGHAVVLDAVYNRSEDRDAVAALVREFDVNFTGLWLDAPAEILRARTAARRGDASDATPAVVESQRAEDTGAIDWLRLDAGGAPVAVAAHARRRLGL